MKDNMGYLINYEPETECCSFREYLRTNNISIIRSNDDDVVTFSLKNAFVMIGAQENVDKLANDISGIVKKCYFLKIYIDDFEIKKHDITCRIINIDTPLHMELFGVIYAELECVKIIDAYTKVRHFSRIDFGLELYEVIREHLVSGNKEDMIKNIIYSRMFDVFEPLDEKHETLLLYITPDHIKAISDFNFKIGIKKNEYCLETIFTPDENELFILSQLELDAMRDNKFVSFYNNLYYLLIKIFDLKICLSFSSEDKLSTISFEIKQDKIIISVETNYLYRQFILPITRLTNGEYLSINRLYLFFLDFGNEEKNIINHLQEGILTRL